MSQSRAPSNPTTTATKCLRRELVLPSLAAAKTFGARLASLLQPGDIVRLEGDLGTGKSELARSVIQARAGARIEVPSPTFTLVQIYDLKDLRIVHADLYRLGQAEEVEELGLLDDPQAALLVEWWSRAEDALPKPGLTIELTQGLAEEAREVKLLASHSAWTDRLESLMS